MSLSLLNAYSYFQLSSSSPFSKIPQNISKHRYLYFYAKVCLFSSFLILLLIFYGGKEGLIQAIVMQILQSKQNAFSQQQTFTWSGI